MMEATRVYSLETDDQIDFNTHIEFWKDIVKYAPTILVEEETFKEILLTTINVEFEAIRFEKYISVLKLTNKTPYHVYRALSNSPDTFAELPELLDFTRRIFLLLTNFDKRKNKGVYS